jgi:hypothetical protein
MYEQTRTVDYSYVMHEKQGLKIIMGHKDIITKLHCLYSMDSLQQYEEDLEDETKDAKTNHVTQYDLYK